MVSVTELSDGGFNRLSWDDEGSSHPRVFLNLPYYAKSHVLSTSCTFCFVVVLTERVGGFRDIRGCVDSDGLTEYRHRTEKTLTV